MNILKSLKRAAGSLIVGGFHGDTLDNATALALQRGELGGVILFRRNVGSPEQIIALNTAVQRARPEDSPPVFVSVDQEGGRVARLKGIATDLPPMAELGGTADSALCRKVGALVGRELGSLGFNVDYAPVLDVHTRPDNPVIGDRSFSPDPSIVAELAGSFADGLLDAGVIPCGKHFPGHGDTNVDSHLDLPVLEHDRRRLSDVEWVPFRRAATVGLPMIMTAHLLVPCFDEEYPATLSAAALRGALRQDLGYQGVIISDDLEMAAVADRYTPAEMAELGLVAGLDLFLVCHSRMRQVAVFETLVRLAERDHLARERLLTAAARVGKLRRRLKTENDFDSSAWRSILRSSAHLAIVEEIRAGTPVSS